MSSHLANLPAQSPVRAMTALAKQIALPHEHAPQRFPSFPALERTALMGFSTPYQWDLGLGASTVADDNRMMLTRQAAYPLWITRAATPIIHGISHYVAMEPPTYTIADNHFYVPNLGPPGYRTAGSRPTTDYFMFTSGFNSTDRIANFPVMGQDNKCSPNPYLFVPAGGTAIFFIGSPYEAFPQNGNALIKYAVWTRPGSEIMGEANVPWASTQRSGAVVMATPYNTWIRLVSVTTTSFTAINIPTNMAFGLYSTPVASAGLAISHNTASLGTIQFSTLPATVPRVLYPVGPPPELVNSRLPWESARTTAAAALFTNVSQALNKNGTVLAGRVNPAAYDVFNTGTAVLSGLHPAEKSYLGLETGLYTYCPPSTDLSDFWDYVAPADIANQGSTVADNLPMYRLDNDALVNIACFDFATGAIPVMAINLDWHIEFRTTSALFQIGMSTMTLESLHLAQMSLHEAGFFFENPEHKNVLTTIVRSVGKFAGVAAPIAGAVHPSAGKALKMVANGSKMLQGSKATPKSTTVAAATGASKPKPPPKGKKGNGKKKK